MTSTEAITKNRIESIDVLRGIVMLIMAIDHTRDFFHQPAFSQSPTDLTTTTTALFFTRWITHFCAPVFLFLSGVSAFISGQRKTKKELSNFLLVRGVWLIVLEIAVMSLILTLNPSYNVFFLIILWAIGGSMLLLGLLVRTSYKVIVFTAFVLFFGHNILDHVSLPAQGIADVLWKIFFTTSGSFFNLGFNRGVITSYAILPWAGIMLTGYTAGYLYQTGFAAMRRKKILQVTGLGLLLLFVLLRFINHYGDPNPWSVQKNSLFTFLSFINVTKYPVSLQYACITLGPALLALALFENQSSWFTRFAVVYGRVPLFYFVLHFALIRIFCVIAFFASGYSVAQAVDPQSPFLFRPAQFGFPLWFVYLVWLAVILSLYYPCRWFGNYKKTHNQWWLSYL